MKKLSMSFVVVLLFSCLLYGTLHAEKATAGKTVEYKVVDVSVNDLEKTLNTYGKQGWRLHTVRGKEGHDRNYLDYMYLILER